MDMPSNRSRKPLPQPPSGGARRLRWKRASTAAAAAAVLIALAALLWPGSPLQQLGEAIPAALAGAQALSTFDIPTAVSWSAGTFNQTEANSSNFLLLQSAGSASVNVTSAADFAGGAFNGTAANDSVFLALGQTEVRGNVSAAPDYGNGNGLVALFHFNNQTVGEFNGSHFQDFSGSGNNGTCSGTNCSAFNATGKIRGAYTFDGVDDYVNLGTSSIITPTSALTVMSWIRFNEISTGTNADSIMSNNEGGGYGILANVDSDGRLQTWFYINGTYRKAGINLNSLANNTWYHVVGTFDGTDTKFYLDGTLKETVTAAGTITTTAYPVTIGVNPGVIYQDYFNGSIDEVAIWNRSLTAAEVAELYNRSAGNRSAGNFSSQVLDTSTTATWTSLNWSSPWNHSGQLANDTMDTTGLVGLWHFNNDSVGEYNGSHFQDNSSAGLNLSCASCAALVPGKLRNAQNFTSLWLPAATPRTPLLTSNATGQSISFWLKPGILPLTAIDLAGTTKNDWSPRGSFACGLLANGSAVCWGNNSVGSLGNGSYGGWSNLPVLVAGGLTFTKLSVGSTATCGIASNGTLYCWGQNYYGLFGNGTGNTGGPDALSNIPIATNNPSLDFVNLSVGAATVCGIVSNGTLYCWGQNTYGHVGIGNFTDPILVPVPSADANAYRMVSVGRADTGDGACGVLRNGTATCWGNGGGRAIGDGGSSSRSRPTPLSGGASMNFSTISRATHTCGVLTNGSVFCWGGNGDGRLGNGSIAPNTYFASPNPIADGNAYSAVSVGQASAAGVGFTCGLLANGTAICWGSNAAGQLGNGSIGNTGMPQPVYGNETYTSIATGRRGACGIRSDNTTVCWGMLPFLLPSTPDVAHAPLEPAGNLSFKSVSVDAYNTATSCGLAVNGTAYCWGDNDNGQVGDGSTTDRQQPVAVSNSANLNFTMLSSAARHACGIATNGTAYCWGLNSNGQVGDGSTTQRTSPVSVANPNLNFSAISAGGPNQPFTCGALTNGTLYCWGQNSVGQLGDGTTTQRTSPTASLDTNAYRSVSAGDRYACGTYLNGTALCWGLNGNGQLGIGNTTNVWIPLPIANAASLNVSSISVQRSGNIGGTTCAVLTNSSLYCWGANGNGQVGDGSGTQRTSPVAVSDASPYAAAFPGGYTSSEMQTCGVQTNGTATCWGSSNYGIFGTGDWTLTGGGSNTPVPGPPMNFTSLSLSARTACGTLASGAALCWGWGWTTQPFGAPNFQNNNTGFFAPVGLPVGKLASTSLYGRNLVLTSNRSVVAYVDSKVYTTSNLSSGWNHVALSKGQGSGTFLYLNGVPLQADGSQSPPLNDSTPVLTVGAANATLDELAVFNRSLLPGEASLLYALGAAKLGLQVRSCNDSSCAGEGWVGPDTTAQSSWNESPITLNATFAPDNRYFQVLANLTTDNTSNSSWLQGLFATYAIPAASQGNYSTAAFDSTKSSTFWNHTNWSSPWNASGQIRNDTFNTTGLVGLWHLNNESSVEYNGSFFLDNSSYGNNGTSTNSSVSPTFNASGKLKGAYTFDGVNDYVSASSLNNIPSGNSAYAISAWIKPSSYGSYGIVGWGNYGTVNQVNAFRLNAPNQLINYWWGNDLTVTATGLTDGSWHHVIAQFDGTTRTIYVDGVLKGSDTPINHNAALANFRVGSTNNGEYFNGSIDELAIWNRSLSAQEVSQLYAMGAAKLGLQVRSCNDSACAGEQWAGPGGNGSVEIPSPAFPAFSANGVNGLGSADNTTGLVGLWHLNNQTVGEYNGSHFEDFSGSGNNGTSTNSTGTFAPAFNASGKLRGAYTFDGVNDYATVGANPSNLQLSTGTISAWLRTSGAGPAYRGIVTKQSAYGMFLKDGVFMIYDWANSADRSSGVNLTDGLWHHVAVSFQSGVANGTQLYIDGISRLTPTMTVNNQNQALEIARGGSAGGQGQSFAGSIDEVAVWNRALSSAEVMNLYLHGAPTYFTDSPAALNSNLAPDNRYGQMLANLSTDNTSNSSWATGLSVALQEAGAGPIGIAAGSNFTCDSGSLSDTCYLSHQHNAQDEELISANNLIIASGGSISNTSGKANITINLTGSLSIETGGLINLKGADCSSGTCVSGNNLTIRLGSNGNLTVNGYINTSGGNNTLDGTGTKAGSAGFINITTSANGNVTVNGQIVANGGGHGGGYGMPSGNAGSVTITTAGPVRITGAVRADGGNRFSGDTTGGNASAITINATTFNLTSAGLLSAAGGLSGSGSCDADRGHRGSGGNVTITALNIVLDGPLSARWGQSGGCNDGNGGLIVLNATSSLNITAAVNALGGGTPASPHGNVSINVSGPVDVSSQLDAVSKLNTSNFTLRSSGVVNFAPQVTLGSDLLTRTTWEGTLGSLGNLTLSNDTLTIPAGASLANSGGPSGNVTISAPTLFDLAGHADGLSSVSTANWTLRSGAVATLASQNLTPSLLSNLTWLGTIGALSNLTFTNDTLTIPAGAALNQTLSTAKSANFSLTSLMVVNGALDLAPPSCASGTCPSGGNLTVSLGSGNLTVSGYINTSGGNNTLDSTGTKGGSAGTVNISTGSAGNVTVAGFVFANGGGHAGGFGMPSGNGNTITITATGPVRITGAVRAEGGSSYNGKDTTGGNASNITINASTLNVTSTGLLSASGGVAYSGACDADRRHRGSGGNITVNATGIVLDGPVRAERGQSGGCDDGNGGTIVLNATSSLNITAAVTALGRGTPANPHGNVSINVSGPVDVSSQLDAVSKLNTSNFTLRSGGVVNFASQVTLGSDLLTRTAWEGTLGSLGNLTLSNDTLTIPAGAALANSGGPSGNVTISAPTLFDLAGHADGLSSVSTANWTIRSGAVATLASQNLTPSLLSNLTWLGTIGALSNLTLSNDTLTIPAGASLNQTLSTAAGAANFSLTSLMLVDGRIDLAAPSCNSGTCKNGGNITVSLGSGNLTVNGYLNTSGGNNTLDSTGTKGGSAGTVNITAGSNGNLTVSGRIVANGGGHGGGFGMPSGNGSNITITVPHILISGSIRADGGSSFSGDTSGANATIIRINATTLNLTASGRISAEGGKGGSGNCDADRVHRGHGGNITIVARDLVLNGSVSASRGMSGGCNDGFGGWVNLTADTILMGGAVNASSGTVGLGNVSLTYQTSLNLAAAKLNPSFYLAKYNASGGRIDWTELRSNITAAMQDFTSLVTLRGQNATVDVAADSGLNKSAQLTFSHSFATPRMRWNNAACPEAVCQLISDANPYVYNVTMWSSHWIEETPVPRLLAFFGLNLTVNGTANNVFVPGSFAGPVNASTLSTKLVSNQTFNFLTSYLGEPQAGLVSSLATATTLFLANTSGNHTLGLNQSANNLTGTQLFLVLTRGDQRSIQEQMERVKAKSFLSAITPSFGYGLGEKLAVQVLAAYPTIDLWGNLTHRRGVLPLAIVNNGLVSGKLQINVSRE